jgi:hypothetical protein
MISYSGIIGIGLTNLPKDELQRSVRLKRMISFLKSFLPRFDAEKRFFCSSTLVVKRAFSIICYGLNP